MWHPPQGVHDLLRAMYYYKSADWSGNRPFALQAWRAEDLAKLPTYYVMNLGDTVAATMAAHMPSPAEIARCRWMSEQDLDVYAGEYARTGFQGGLNAYRILTEPRFDHAFDVAGGRIIEVPASFIGGAEDWGVRQGPGNFEAMQHGVCRQLVGVHLVKGAGHSLAEEQPAEVNRLLLDFLDKARSQA
jgi:pimeloyl-ACP methyl ester carboxylesterase